MFKDCCVGNYLSSFTTNSSLVVFLKLLSFNSIHRVELNQTRRVNQIQQDLIYKISVYWYVWYISPRLQAYTLLYVYFFISWLSV